ncbi:hypothetical protein BpHYR1_020285 [Brachionus plicatilis]|uniref:Uncharacterized protein n=1 Tax=Brachionus plicatilis TaxID=10195 RepID=A0A3M7PA25_BRAPC|nr:hypothetical protein BpHYR1_020285 [Brachionus plicatilis]
MHSLFVCRSSSADRSRLGAYTAQIQNCSLPVGKKSPRILPKKFNLSIRRAMSHGELNITEPSQIPAIISKVFFLVSLHLNGYTITNKRSMDAAIMVDVFTLIDKVEKNGSSGHMMSM